MKSSVVDDSGRARESAVSWDDFRKAKHGISSISHVSLSSSSTRLRCYTVTMQIGDQCWVVPFLSLRPFKHVLVEPLMPCCSLSALGKITLGTHSLLTETWSESRQSKHTHANARTHTHTLTPSVTFSPSPCCSPLKIIVFPLLSRHAVIKNRLFHIWSNAEQKQLSWRKCFRCSRSTEGCRWVSCFRKQLVRNKNIKCHTVYWKQVVLSETNSHQPHRKAAYWNCPRTQLPCFGLHQLLNASPPTLLVQFG